MTNPNDNTAGGRDAPAEAVWDNLRASGGSLVDQLQVEALAAYKSVVTALQGETLSPEEEEDLEWAVNTLTASAVLSIGATAEQLGELGRNRAAAISVLSNIRAVKAKDAQQLVLFSIQKVIGIATTFLVHGAEIAIAAL